MTSTDVFNIANISKCSRYPIGKIDDYTHQIDILKYFANLVHFDDLPKEKGLSIAISVINNKKTMSLSGIRQVKVRFNRLLYKLDHSYHDDKMKDWVIHPKINRRKYNRTAKNKNDLYDKPYKYNRRIRERKYTSDSKGVTEKIDEKVPETIAIYTTDNTTELVDVQSSLPLNPSFMDSMSVDTIPLEPESVIHYIGNITYDCSNGNNENYLIGPFNPYVDKKATFIIKPELFNFESDLLKKDAYQIGNSKPLFPEIEDRADLYYTAAW
jgi:hypothetical protein